MVVVMKEVKRWEKGRDGKLGLVCKMEKIN